MICERGVVVRSDGRCCAWWRLAFLGGLGVWAVLCCGSCLCAATSLMYEAVRGVVGRSSSAVRSAGFQPMEAEGLVVDDDASMSSSALWRRGTWALGRRLVLALVVGARVGGAGPRSYAGHRFAYAAHGRLCRFFLYLVKQNTGHTHTHTTRTTPQTNKGGETTGI